MNEDAAPAAHGFSLLEVLMALLLLTSVLLAAGHMLYLAASAGSLARSKATAALAAQDLLESLSEVYQRNPSSPDLAWGEHGPKPAQVTNPTDGNTLNRYSIAWSVQPVSDPRPGKNLDARLITAIVSPSLADETVNNKPGLNKIISVSTIIALRAQ